MIVKYRNNSFFLMSSLNLISNGRFTLMLKGYHKTIFPRNRLIAKALINGFKSISCVIFRINFTYHITQKHKLSV